MERDIACELDVFTTDESTRHRELLTTLRQGIAGASDVPGGRRFLLHNVDLVPAAAEFILYESRCCSFFRFAIEVEEGGGPASLTVSGPEAGLDLISNALALD